MTPIPITFSRELPTEEGIYLHLVDDLVDLVTVQIRDGKTLLHKDGLSVVLGVNPYGEFAGPLQLISASPTEAAEE